MPCNSTMLDHMLFTIVSIHLRPHPGFVFIFPSDIRQINKIYSKLRCNRLLDSTLLITPEVIKEYPVIINCTPLGMYPNVNECPPLPYEALSNRNLLYDLIYNPDETLFMRKGRQQGAVVMNGLEMLLLQAFASWDFWQE